MFGLFGSKKECAPIKKTDYDHPGYQEAIACLAGANMEWLMKSKFNAEMTLCSLDMNSVNLQEKRAVKLRQMISGMTHEEYQEWLRTVVFH